MRQALTVIALGCLLLGCDDAGDAPPRGSVEAMPNPAEAEGRQVVTLTPKAADMVRQMARDNGMTGEWLLAVSVQPAGGGTYRYNLDLEEDIEVGNRLQSRSEGIMIAVERDAEGYLAGTTIDYRVTEAGEGFWFDNPNIEGLPDQD